MGESTDTFTQGDVQGRKGMVSLRREDTSRRVENGPKASQISLVIGMHVSTQTWGASRHH